MPEDPVSRVARNHVEHRTIVIPELKLLYVPVPKTGWTGMLWSLAPLAGLTPADFRSSVKPEISMSMAVHDEAIWGRRGRLLRNLSPAVREEALGSPEWLRFAVVRDPARRLWSAWQSKFLLREPVYFGFHGQRSWYPRLPDNSVDVVADFRAFIDALTAGWSTDTKMRDPHWGLQSDVLNVLPLNYVGRAERLGQTEERIRDHVSAHGGAGYALRRENAMPLAYDAVVFDQRAADTTRRLYGPDFAAFHYAPPQPVAASEYSVAFERWSVSVSPAYAHLRDLIDRHQRLFAVVGEFNARLRAEQAESAGLKKQLADVDHQRRDALARSAALSNQLERARTRHARLTGSASWRVTAPLRRLSRWVRARRQVE